MQNILDRICSSAQVPSVPIVAANVLKQCSDPSINFRELANLISADMGLAAKMLRMANSVAYGSQAPITSLHRALVRMGVKVTRVAALGFALEAEIGKSVPKAFEIQRFWRHSLTTASTARAIAAIKCPAKRDEAFAAGLLQDIGLVAIQFALPEKMEKIFAERKRLNAELHQIEKKLIGTTHMDVGAHLLRQWGLPAEVYEPIRYHHRLHQAERAGVSSETIQVGHLLFFATLVTRLFNYTDETRTREAAILVAEEDLNISAESLDRILTEVEQNVRETCDLFSVDPRTVPSYESIRIQATQQMATMGMALTREAEEASARAEKQREELDTLKAESDQLKMLASHDELTGLPNRREFMNCFKNEVARARRYRHAIGLLMLDIDRFKSVNDTFGHPVGDAVLRALGKLLPRMTRQNDLSGRLGGEEFAIMLPEPERVEGVAAAAEKLREAVASASRHWVEQLDGVTVSIGAVFVTPASGKFEADAIIEEADRLLYEAKNNGRNQVCSAEA